MLRSIDWVLEHSTSVWCGVIRDRMAAGQGPEPKARLFRIEQDTFATVRFPDGRADLTLAVNMAPAGDA